ncbi:hypothetical protein FRX31_006876, partial [Thalictrum thalictroides]
FFFLLLQQPTLDANSITPLTLFKLLHFEPDLKTKAPSILKRVGCTFLYKFQLRFKPKLISRLFLYSTSVLNGWTQDCSCHFEGTKCGQGDLHWGDTWLDCWWYVEDASLE